MSFQLTKILNYHNSATAQTIFKQKTHKSVCIICDDLVLIYLFWWPWYDTDIESWWKENTGRPLTITDDSNSFLVETKCLYIYSSLVYIPPFSHWSHNGHGNIAKLQVWERSRHFEIAGKLPMLERDSYYNWLIVGCLL